MTALRKQMMEDMRLAGHADGTQQHYLASVLFTGSVAVGREVMRAAANNLTPVTLDLGGKVSGPRAIPRTPSIQRWRASPQGSGSMRVKLVSHRTISWCPRRKRQRMSRRSLNAQRRCIQRCVTTETTLALWMRPTTGACRPSWKTRPDTGRGLSRLIRAGALG